MKSQNRGASGASHNYLQRCARGWLAPLACAVALLFAIPAAAVPSYFSYWGLGRNITETQDHVNLYWVVSWDWNGEEILSQLADAKARGMRAMVHTEFALLNGGCPVTLKSDAAANRLDNIQSVVPAGGE